MLKTIFIIISLFIFISSQAATTFCNQIKFQSIQSLQKLENPPGSSNHDCHSQNKTQHPSKDSGSSQGCGMSVCKQNMLQKDSFDFTFKVKSISQVLVLNQQKLLLNFKLSPLAQTHYHLSPIYNQKTSLHIRLQKLLI